MKKLFGITLAAGLAASAAIAGGTIDPGKGPGIITPITVPAATAYDWTGPYAGVTLGYGKADWSASPGTPIAGGEQSSWGGALHGGYNMDMGNWVGGAEVDFVPGGLADLDLVDYDFDWGARLRLRGGPKLGDDGRTFAYGSVGLGLVRTTELETDESHTDVGWSAGLGVAHALSDRMFVSGEISHFRVNDIADSTSDVRANAAQVGLSFRF